MTDALKLSPEPEEAWGCVPDSTSTYQVEFSTRAEAVAALNGEPGAVVRCRRGFPRGGLEYHFDVEALLSQIEERAEAEGQVLAQSFAGLFNTNQVEEEMLQRMLADALHRWIEAINPPCWAILDLEDVEASPHAEDHVP